MKIFYSEKILLDSFLLYDCQTPPTPQKKSHLQFFDFWNLHGRSGGEFFFVIKKIFGQNFDKKIKINQNQHFLLLVLIGNDLTKRIDQVTFSRKVYSFRDIGRFLMHYLIIIT